MLIYKKHIICIHLWSFVYMLTTISTCLYTGFPVNVRIAWSETKSTLQVPQASLLLFRVNIHCCSGHPLASRGDHGCVWILDPWRSLNTISLEEIHHHFECILRLTSTWSHMFQLGAPNEASATTNFTTTPRFHCAISIILVANL